MDITIEIIADFRDCEPAYTSNVKWPDSIVKKALCEGDYYTGASAWGKYKLGDCHSTKLRGMYLYAAHWLYTQYIGSKTGDATDPGDISPAARLNVAGSSKSVRDESTSVQYRIGAMQDTEDDWLSLSNYGVQYLRLRATIVNIPVMV